MNGFKKIYDSAELSFGREEFDEDHQEPVVDVSYYNRDNEQYDAVAYLDIGQWLMFNWVQLSNDKLKELLSEEEFEQLPEGYSESFLMLEASVDASSVERIDVMALDDLL